MINYETAEQCEREMKRLTDQAEELKRQAKLQGNEPSEWILDMMRERYRDVKDLHHNLSFEQGKLL